VDLSSEAIVLVLAGELHVLESSQDLSNALGGFGQHGLHRDAYPDVAGLLQFVNVIAHLEQGLDDLSVVRELADGFIDAEFDFLFIQCELVGDSASSWH